MGLFKSKAPRQAAEPTIQIPDELAEEARLLYGHQNFAGAAATYAKAIDKIHTMCVVAQPASRIRTLGERDQAIAAGFASSVGAALAMDPQSDVRTAARFALPYLLQIADQADLGSLPSSPYRLAIENVEFELRKAGANE